MELRTMNPKVELVLKHKKAIMRKSEFLMLEALGDCCNSFFVFVSDRSRSGLAENLGQICFS